ncbi:MAG: hypothetical protein KAQ98_13455 [Bacteriovoracaceae bacterium]|nr:hypothetical protein [Bacteriovoracaceae bacterium]
MSETLEQKMAGKEVEISHGELAKYRFAPGDVYWVKMNGKLVRLLTVGDYIDREFIQKFTSGNMSLMLDRIINEDYLNDGISILEGMRKGRSIKERASSRTEFIDWLNDVFWSGEKEGSLIDLIILGEKVFFAFEDEFAEKLVSGNTEFFTRSALMGILNVIFAINMGYMDDKLLCDIYNLPFLVDYFMHVDGYAFDLIRALEMERKSSGNGREWLEFKGDKMAEHNMFFEHPDKSARLVLEDCKKYFHSEEMVSLIEKHHERMDGSGFPEGIYESELSDLETLFISVNQAISFKLEFVFGDGKKYLKNIIAAMDEDENEIFSARIRSVFENIFECSKQQENENPEESEAIEYDEDLHELLKESA